MRQAVGCASGGVRAGARGTLVRRRFGPRTWRAEDLARRGLARRGLARIPTAPQGCGFFFPPRRGDQSRATPEIEPTPADAIKHSRSSRPGRTGWRGRSPLQPPAVFKSAVLSRLRLPLSAGACATLPPCVAVGARTRNRPATQRARTTFLLSGANSTRRGDLTVYDMAQPPSRPLCPSILATQ
jgi:hypothetical protein